MVRGVEDFASVRAELLDIVGPDYFQWKQQ